MWSTAVYDTQSGDRVEAVGSEGGKWGRGDVTTRTHSFRLVSMPFTRSQRRDLFSPWERTLVQFRDGQPVYAGLISDTDYDRDKGTLSVSHVDIRALLSRRFLFGVGSYTPKTPVVCKNLSLRGIASRLAHLGFVEPFSAAWPVPVNVPAEQAGSEDRTYQHYEFQTVEEALSEIEDAENGPDTDLQPKLNNDRLEWDFRIGSPLLTGPAWDFVLAADEPQLSKVRVREDAAKQATGIFAVGKGSEVDMRVGSKALTSAAGLSKDFMVAFKDISSQSRLNSHAASVLKSRSAATVQWSLNVQAAAVNPAELRIGSTIHVYSEGDLWIEDGWTHHHVIGFSGDFSETIALELQEV